MDPMVDFANVISEMISNAKEERIFTARVKKVNPIEVEFNGIILRKQNLRILGSLNALLNRDILVREKYKYELKVNDSVLLIERNGIYIIIDKLEGV